MDIDELQHASHVPHLDPFEHAGNLESTFYEEGYRSGFDHGRLHGLFEGRALGQEKCFELWEEVGYYEGFAGFWVGALTRSMEGREGTTLSHAKQLLALISNFPTTNPTPTPTPTPTPSAPQASGSSSGADSLPAATFAVTGLSDPHVHVPVPLAEPNGVGTGAAAAAAAGAEPDLPSLLGSIRGRYKLLCASLGARPRLVAAPNQDTAEGGPQGTDTAGEGMVVEGIEGPMKGVDTRRLRF
ncbi:hypothetical protein JCM24511_05157 [Saitozyma sp. JCM 24511]|nr:hypothetical protein JCM24511_05157 [Saitozyma sp. JCM 24511]